MGVFVLLHSCVRSFLCVCAAGYFWSLYMTTTGNIGMPAHTAQIPDYATRVCHNMTTSLPVFSILYPSIRRYTVKQTRESETPVDRQSLKRRGGLLHNLLCSVNRVIRTPFLIQGWFEALSLALYTISESIAFIPKMVKGKKADVTQVKLTSIQTGGENLSSQPQSEPPQTQKSLKDLEETPPPSRPPSPPPSPTYSARSRESDWSIDIEELSDEPRPAVQSQKDKKRSDRRRSSSWSRSLRNSFRKKKNKEKNLEDLYKTEPLPDNFPAKLEEEAGVAIESIEPEGDESRGPDKNVQIDESMEESPAPGPVQDEAVIVVETRAKAPSVERSHRMSKMLSFGTFGRRKSLTIPQEQAKSDRQESENQENPEIEVQSKQEKKPESKLEVKTKADKKGKHDEADGESVQLKQESTTKSNKREKSKSKERKTKKNEKEKSEENIVIDEMQIEAESVFKPTVAKVKEDKKTRSSLKKTKSNHKSIFSFKSKSVEQVPPEIDVDAVQLNEQQTDSTPAVTKSEAPASVKPKRKTIANLFKREKSIKEDETRTESSVTDTSTLKKAGMFRNSFARSKKTKSMDVETIPHEEIPEKEKKTRRSTSVAFGSSFSLKKMFQSDSPLDLVDQNPGSKGILSKRSKRTSSSRPKSVQLDETPLEIENVQIASQGELRSSRSKLGERFMSFTRDSLRITKRQRSKTGEQTVGEIEDETFPVQPMTIEAEVKSVTAQNVTETEFEGTPTNAGEIPVNPVAESMSSEVQVDGAAIPSPLHLDYEPKHGILRAWFRILLLYCVHEAISRPLFDVDFCFVCILCLISFGFLVAANFAR